MVGTLDSLSLKNTKLGLETLGLMDYDPKKIQLVLNRADTRVSGSASTTSSRCSAASRTIFIPSDREIPRSVNEGIPITLSRPQSYAAASFHDLAALFTGGAEPQATPEPARAEAADRALLLSPDAEIDTKPELEIFADDVKCSHGATVGELDADQLFYLRSRGIPDEEARSMLVRAFLAEALDAVTNEAVRGVLDRAVEGWWERQAA